MSLIELIEVERPAHIYAVTSRLSPTAGMASGRLGEIIVQYYYIQYRSFHKVHRYVTASTKPFFYESQHVDEY